MALVDSLGDDSVHPRQNMCSRASLIVCMKLLSQSIALPKWQAQQQQEIFMATMHEQSAHVKPSIGLADTALGALILGVCHQSVTEPWVIDVS